MINYQYLKLLCLLTCGAVSYSSLPAIAQIITPAADGTGTVINTQGDHFNIEGGRYNSDRRNLFHSFDRFNLNPGQTANFITAPQVQNILGKVRGGDTSVINGLLQVTGSQANLFLINPAGIIFGSQARLNLPAAFTATTANAIKFDQFWLNVVGDNNYGNLLNNPTAYSFDQTQPAMIINQGNLSLLPAKSLNLFGHAVLNTGTISVPGGNITITAMAPDQHILKVSPTGHVLNWELTTNTPADFFQQTHNLPALLTGPIEQIPADIIKINEQGQVVLQSNSEIISSGRAIAAGNLDVSDLNTGKTGGVVNIFADQVQLINSRIQANGDYGGGLVRLGGDRQGKGILPTARQTLVDAQSQINANALTLGNGGDIVVWSQENTNFAGTIRAIAGQFSGNGGSVEISSQGNLLYQGNIDVNSMNGQVGRINISQSPLIRSSQLEETLPDIEIPTFPEPPTIPPPDDNTGTIPDEPEPEVTEPEIPTFPETPNIPLPGENPDPNNPQQDLSIPSIPPFPNVPNIPPPGNNIARPEDDILTPTIPNFPAPPNIPLPGDNTGGPGQGVGIPTIPNFPSPPNIQPPGSTTGEIITSPTIPNFPSPPNLRPPGSIENFVPEPVIPAFPAPPNLRPPSSGGIVVERFIPEPIIPDFPPAPQLTPPPSQFLRDQGNVTRIATSLQVERSINNKSTTDLNNQTFNNNLDNLLGDQALITAGSVVLPSVSNDNIRDVTSTIDNIMTDQFTQHLNTEFNNNFSSIEAVQANLQAVAEQTGKKPAIIYVILRSDQIDLIIVPPDQGKITYRTVNNVTKEEVLNTANDLRKEITNPVKRNTKSYLPFAQQMYKWLMTPLAQDLQDLEIDTLGFILDSGLRTFPIATLHDGEKFIIENYSIGLIPSINLVNMTYRNLEDAHVLAMGASQFTELNPLPAVPLELSTITTEWQGRYFLNRDFTFDNLRKSRQAYPYRIVHLATHGEFLPGDLSNSFIQLWDEKLRLDQLRELKWSNPPVDLLVLSACRTAVGDETVELGFAGLAVQAGAKSALASLWYVSDAGTLGFMADFYRYLQSAAIKADALRLTQIDMIQGRIRIKAGSIERDSFRGEGIILPPELSDTNDRVLSHPYYWAAFTMIGSPW
jgi:filamentous hemagglutinin family protein